MNIIVFSKDRAAQLDLFMRSMVEYFSEYIDFKIYVIYTYSSNVFKKGYDELIKLYEDINFITETNFKKDVLSTIDPNLKFTTFFVDDIIWKESFSINDDKFILFEQSTDILCLSLRLNSNLNYCYAANHSMTLPISYDNGVWNWRGERGDYGYPMSLDGHIFKTQDILPLLQRLIYKNPNQLEAMLSYSPINKPKMMCYDKSKIINNPANKVQTNNPNKHGSISAEYINEQFLKGYMIDLEPYRNINNTQCHLEMPINFIKDE